MQTLCSYRVTYAFQGQCTLYSSSSLNVKEILARNSREIRSLSDCNWIRAHNHLICKWTLNNYGCSYSFIFYVLATISPNKPNDWAMLWGLIFTVHLIFLSYISYCCYSSYCSSICICLNFRFRVCFWQRVPWHSGNYRVWNDSKARTWHDKRIKSNARYR